MLLVFGLVLALAGASRAAPVLVEFSAQVGRGNNFDNANVFGEGVGANLAGQVISGSVTIDPASLTQLCGTGGACYGDFGAGAISVSFRLNGFTSTVVSSGTLGYFGGRSGGSVQISDPLNGGYNYLAVGATSADGMVQQSIGVLFNAATLFNAFGNGVPGVAVASLGSIGGGGGLVTGGVTLLSPIEHLDATIVGVNVPEPPGLALFGPALLLVGLVRRKRAG